MELLLVPDCTIVHCLHHFCLISGRVIDWSIDFLKTASGASQVYEVDYTSALLEEGGKQFDKVRHSTFIQLYISNFLELK